MIAHLTTQRNAIAMLNQRIKFLHQYLQDVKQGNIPMDHDVVRQIASLCRRSPVIERETFDEQFSTVKSTLFQHDDDDDDTYYACMKIGIQRCLASRLFGNHHKGIEFCERFG